MPIEFDFGESLYEGRVGFRLRTALKRVAMNTSAHCDLSVIVNEFLHLPVLQKEVIEALNVKPNGIYVDATYGRGGHAAEILSRLDKHGRVFALDRDPEAILAARRRFGNDPRFSATQLRFSMIGQFIESQRLTGQVNGILFDLGMSSVQLDDPERGFSFQHDGPLDMRMDPASGVSAAHWINSASDREIAKVLRDFGEERYAKRIAQAIINERQREPIDTTLRLAGIVARAVPTREPGKHPATRTFLAIRLFVNAELEELQAALPQTLGLLALGGRLVVISFHSLEDRIVKRFMREQARGEALPARLPVRSEELKPRLKLVGKPVRASEAEVQRNVRARSAILRVAERVGGECA